MLSWLTFLNASLLVGTAAFAIPLIIHLLNRSRFKTVDWGAMIFLDDALKANTRRFEWQKWLLLLLRCLIPICLAVCMARPLVQNSFIASRLPGGQTTATCLLVDNSLSMEANEEGQANGLTTRFDAAQNVALKLIELSARNSRWAIGSTGMQATDAINFNSRDIHRQKTFLESMPRGLGVGDPMSALDKAMEALKKNPEGRSQIIVVSDFQKSMCDSIEPNQVVAMRERLEALPRPPLIVFIPVGKMDSDEKHRENLTVRIDTLTPSVVGVGQPWEIRLAVKNFGMSSAQAAKLVLSVDGTSVASKSLDVPGGAETQVTFSMSFTESGSHQVEAKLEADDTLPADNQAFWSVLALDSIPVLIVDSLLGDRKLMPESDFLHAALAPFEEDPDNRDNLFRVTRIRSDEWKNERLADYKILILANVSKLSDSAVEPLEQHVRSGGILAIFAGDRLDVNWYNKKLSFLPCWFDQKPQVIESTQEGLKLRRENFLHPAIRFLNDPRVGSLENLDVHGWYPLQSKAKNDETQPSTLLSLDNGDVFLVERTLGEGCILQCATTCSDRWTNWPMRPIYLPMIQQILLYSTPPIRWSMNVETGQPLSLPSKQVLNWMESSEADKTGRVSLSVNEKEVTGKSARPTDRLADTSGFVWQLPNGQESDANSIIADVPGSYVIQGLMERPLSASAQAPMKESDLEIESTDGLQSLADRLGATIARSPYDFASLEKSGSRELWRWFLLGLLVLLFGELFLQRYLSGVAA